MIKKIVLMLMGVFLLNNLLAQQEVKKEFEVKIFNKEEQKLIDLSKKKWLWMSNKNTDSLSLLFNEKSMFVHMGGSWGKDKEIEIIKSGAIWYKKADIHDLTVNIIGKTAIFLNKITLLAVVGGKEVINPFMVTEVYVKYNKKWTLGSLTFSKLLVPDDVKK